MKGVSFRTECNRIGNRPYDDGGLEENRDGHHRTGIRCLLPAEHAAAGLGEKPVAAARHNIAQQHPVVVVGPDANRRTRPTATTMKCPLRT